MEAKSTHREDPRTHAAPDDFVEVFHIPTLPDAVFKVRELLLKEDVNISDVSNALGQDPPLAARVLQAANSAQVGASEPRISIHSAVTMIGLRAVAASVLRASVISAFGHVKDMEGFCLEDIWTHSILVATVSEDLAKSCRHRVYDSMPQEYYTCGLLHDIGKIILYDKFGEEYVRAVNQAKSSPVSSRAHVTICGHDHAEIGARAASAWNLPKPIPDILRFHHRPMDNPPLAELISVIACADEIAKLVVEKPTAKAFALATEIRTIPPGAKPETLVRAVICAQQVRSSERL